MESVEDLQKLSREAALHTEAARDNFRLMSQDVSTAIAPINQATDALKAVVPELRKAIEAAKKAHSHNMYAYNQLHVATRRAEAIGTNTVNPMVNQANGIVANLSREAEGEQVRTLLSTPATCEGLILNILADINALDTQASLSEVSMKAEEFVAGAQEATTLYENSPGHW